MRARFVPLVLIGALALAGCGGSGSTGHASPTGPQPTATTPAPTDPSTTLAQSGPPAPASPTVPADVPTTGPNLRSPGEKPPVMPLEATQHTPAGAVAFARFFIQTIDWGFATTSGAYMRHYYAASCVECRSHADGLDNTRKAGHHYLGGRFTIHQAGRAASDGRDGSEQAVDIIFDIGTLGIYDGKTFLKGDVPHLGTQRRIWLAWRVGTWVVVDMGEPSP